MLHELEQDGIRLNRDEPMSQHTAFRIGGAVTAMVFPDGEAQLIQVLARLKQTGTRPFILGNGSNLLAADEAIDKIVIKTSDGLSEIRRSGENTVYAAAGAQLSQIAVFAQNEGLSGLEFAHGIPGTLGGAIVMNAGAYGGEMAQVVTSVRYVDEQGEIAVATGDALGFAYRHSRFSHTDCVVLSAEIKLIPGNPADIRHKMDDLAARRRQSQPLNYPSAGSTFKRPKVGYAAAMIEEAGLKGYTVGGAKVSEKHAGFIVNHNKASCADVRQLMAHVQEVVFVHTGIMLEPEVEFIE